MILPRMFIWDYELKEIRQNKDKISGVYFIQPKDGGPIKIGRSTNITNRLKEIQVSYPSKLRVIKIIKDIDPNKESELHKKFEKYRLRGEWFSKEILNLIDTIVPSSKDCGGGSDS